MILREIKEGSPAGCDHVSLAGMRQHPFPRQDKGRNPSSRVRKFTAAPQPHGTPQPHEATPRQVPGGFVTCNLPKLEKRQERERKATPATATPGCPPARCFPPKPAPALPAQPPRHCSAARIAPPRKQNPRDAISVSPARRKQNKWPYFCALRSFQDSHLLLSRWV